MADVGNPRRSRLRFLYLNHFHGLPLQAEAGELRYVSLIESYTCGNKAFLCGWNYGEAELSEFDGFSQLLSDQPSHQTFQALPGFDKDEILLLPRPVEFETAHPGGNPDLLDGSIRGNHEFSGGIIETNVQRAGIFLYFHINIFFSANQAFLQVFNRGIGTPAEFKFVHEHDYKRKPWVAVL